MCLNYITRVAFALWCCRVLRVAHACVVALSFMHGFGFDCLHAALNLRVAFMCMCACISCCVVLVR